MVSNDAEAEILALKALEWLVADSELFEIFLALSLIHI